MRRTLHVDVTTVDPTQFKIFHEAGESLVIPRKDKFRWAEGEVHLRSLVLDSEGHVVSAGFPKFFNLGENPAHDRALSEAMAGGGVEFPEKIDGSLIVADRIGGVARLRTRGRRDLGELAADVEPLVARLYPRLMPFLHTAMKLFDADVGDAQLIVDAAALDQSASTLLVWKRDPDGEIRATLTAPVREDDG